MRGYDVWEKFENKKGKILSIFPQVEVRGIEPLSKHILQKLSTCLFDYYLSEENRKSTNQFFS